MGALDAISSWIPQDDLLLKNSIEAGASLESLAKGAVQFSRRYTIRELQDRWYSILYDPVVSAEVSACMTELELSTLALPSKSPKPRNFTETKRILGIRRANSVRKCYHAMRKRIFNGPFNSMDLNFLVAPSSGDCNENGDETSENCMPRDHDSNHFRFQELNVDITNPDFSEALMDNVAACGNCETFHTFYSGPHEEEFSIDPNIIHSKKHDVCEENLPAINNYAGVQELDEPKHHDLFEGNDLEAMPESSFHPINGYSGAIPSEFDGSTVFKQPISDCDISFLNVSSSPLPSTPLDVDIRELEQALEEAFSFHENGNDVRMSEDEFKSSHVTTDGYCNSLLNFTNDEDFMSMNDGEYVAHNSFDNGVDSLMENHPRDAKEEVITSMAEPEEVVPDVSMVILGAACKIELGDHGRSSDGDGHINCDLGVQIQSSILAVNHQFPNLCSQFISCTLNSEDPDIPCNDDIFLPNEIPTASPPAIISQSFVEAQSPSSSLKDKIEIAAPTERGSGAMRTLKPPAVAHSAQLSCRGKGISCGNPGQISSINVNTDGLVSRKVNAEAMEVQFEKPSGRHGSQGVTTLNVRCCNKLESENHSTPSWEESLCDSDADIPSFSDVEAMILDMDLSPEEEEIYSIASRYRQEETKRAIIRLEQGAYSLARRTIASHGAFAVLYGRNSRHYIKKLEVLIGRDNEDFDVDIDLGKEDCANRISRRQASIKMDRRGSFNLTNLGKRSISVNEKKIAPGKNLSLHSNCLIEIRGMPFIFETNQKCVKQYLNQLKKEYGDEEQY